MKWRTFFFTAKQKKRRKWAHEYQLLKQSPVDWEEYVRAYPQAYGDPVVFFLEHFRQCPLHIEGRFDSEFYLTNNPDVMRHGVNPLVHYLRSGQFEGRPAWPGAMPCGVFADSDAVDYETEQRIGPEARRVLERVVPDWDVVLADLGEKNRKSAIKRISQDAERGCARVVNFFDQKLYERLYPDTLRSIDGSLAHYLLFGMAEGRVAWLDMEDKIAASAGAFSSDRQTIIVVSHEASKTGAPVVALEIASRLAKTHNVISICLREGELSERFAQVACLHLDTPLYANTGVHQYLLERLLAFVRIDALVLNSVESLSMLDAAASMGLPTVSLLHEFAEYTRPMGKISRTLFTADRVVFPASTLARSALREFKWATASTFVPNNIRIHPQGYLGFNASGQVDTASDAVGLREQLKLDDDAIIVTGAGHVQQRKGVDWFIQTCHYLYQRLLEAGDVRAERLVFVWIGSGYDLDDVHVSVWLDTYLQHTGLKSRFHFPGGVDDVKRALQDCDVYLLTSRLDPFPNVAVDAMAADCGLGVFDHASGIYDFVIEHDLRAVTAPYGDCYRLASRLAGQLDTLARRDGVNKRACQKYLDFNQYVAFLEKTLAEAVRCQAEITELLNDEARFSRQLDSDFYHSSSNVLSSEREFLVLLQKGLVFSKPYPGSDAQRALAELDPDTAFSEKVGHVMASNASDYPVCRLIGQGVSSKPVYKRIAVHLHVFYPELIAEFSRHFAYLDAYQVDLYITHVAPLTEEDRACLHDCVNGKVYFFQMENLGRDVYPFYRMMVEHIGFATRYDLVGHFHTKKSGDNSDGVGDRWRRYLLANLIGSSELLNELLGLFDDPATGLVFAEDAHCIDETENGPWIETLAAQMHMERQAYYHHFPVGNMFWARPTALKALNLIDQRTLAIAEPVAYDGTPLHALERMWPQIVTNAGFSAIRVYTPNTGW